jgi:phosphatidylethanolamine/phosphatidyl-N-methylethanolamine N-methyltransferase
MLMRLRESPGEAGARASTLFLRRGMRQPRQICSVLPSSRYVGRAFAAAIADRPAQRVVELGGGTGAITRQLLDGGMAPDALTVVEIDTALSLYLARSFPAVEVMTAPAQTLSAVWQRDGRAPAGAVVSTLPLRIFDPATIDAVLQSAFAIMAPGGRFVQFTYRFASPVDRGTIRRFGLKAERTAVVWPNLPPATIWAYRREDA